MNVPVVMEEMRRVFEEDSESYKSYTGVSQQILDSRLSEIDPYVSTHEWAAVESFLNEAASRITVREINGGSADALNYFDHQNGLSVIAIGGDKLSRGLTLEGLSVSYYLRASRMYDTLMQMGRWFGYRPGYVDLCRLFISRELNEWFCHITLASEQLRDEFDYMADIAGSTPDQYVLRVRTHPGVLQISASNKIRRAVEVEVSWSGRLIESYELSKDPVILQRNLDAALGLISSLGSPDETSRKYYLWRGVELAQAKAFLRGFEIYDSLKSASPSSLLRFIGHNESHGELDTWTIGVVTKFSADRRYEYEGLSIGLIERSEDENKENEEVYFINKSHIISPDHEFIDLSPEEYQAALEHTQRLWQNAKREGQPSYPSGEVVRNTVRKPNRPLLLLYFLHPRGAGLDTGLPIIGYAISFPGNDRRDAVSFAVHQQLLEQFNELEDTEIIPQDNDD